jgi:hypothetical protein
MSTPLIDSYMTDYKSLVLECALNPLLPVEMVMAIADCFEIPDRELLNICMHEIHCKWCQDLGYNSHCPGFAGAGCTSQLAIEVFGGDKRIKSVDEAYWGLINRSEYAHYD